MNIFSELSTENKQKRGETIVVDYIGANAGKPLHIAHICTPSIGQTIVNVHEHLGYNVIGDSHFCDWGGIFGKIIWAYKYLEPLIVDDSLSISENHARHITAK